MRAATEMTEPTGLRFAIWVCDLDDKNAPWIAEAEREIRYGGAWLPGRISGHMTDLHVTRFGRGIMGMPLKPRPSRGFRRHIRRAKARNHG